MLAHDILHLDQKVPAFGVKSRAEVDSDIVQYQQGESTCFATLYVFMQRFLY